MVCKPAKTTPTIVYTQNIINKQLTNTSIDLKEKGVAIFFYHSPSSKYPIRDVLMEQKRGYKTEPHIEIGAENYLSACHQRGIAAFLDRSEKYVFLMTRCRSRDAVMRPFYGMKCIVGYITNDESGINCKYEKGDVRYVRGAVCLYSFEDSLPTIELGFHDNARFKRVNEANTRIILGHFKGRENILNDCIKEIIRLDTGNKTCSLTYDKPCIHEKVCHRRTLLK